MMGLIHVNDDGQFSEALNRAGKSALVVCDFFAHWCGPCRHIAPVFEQLANKYPAATFLKIDVDRCRMTSQMYQVRAMPTFVLLMNGQELDRMMGADVVGLERMIVQHLPPHTSSSSGISKQSNTAATPGERDWLSQLVHDTKRMALYEDEISQTLALSLIPMEELRAKSKHEDDGSVDEYAMAKHLMAWFHDSFFQWVNTPACEQCGERCDGSSMQNHTCTTEEMADGASRVELYQCEKCATPVRFPRYNNPAKLLETRRGRCGEWANCFALCCRAAGLETRWVTDNLDHVWVEIYSSRGDRWVHCDPCENAIDTPLMYTMGWGKRYAYVFGIAIDHVRDVTWRYTLNHRAVIKRRTKCREHVLRNFLNKLNKRLGENMPPERGKRFQLTYMKELVEFLSPKCQQRDGSQAQAQGRQSGDVEWRKDRGELQGAGEMNNIIDGQAIKPSKEEKELKCLILRYNCAKDCYTRPNAASSKATVSGWEKLVTYAEGVFRKIEPDWAKCYLCRKPGVASGAIVWRFDLSGVKARKIEIDLGKLDTFEDGQVLATACYGDMCTRITGPLVAEELSDNEFDYLEIRVELSGGKGQAAWQHAQLFRSDLGGGGSTDSMNVKISFA